MQSKKIIFISLYDLTALGTKSLHSILMKNNFNVKTFFFKKNLKDIATEDEIENFAEIIKKEKPAIVGINVMSTILQDSIIMTKKIKEKTGALVIWGGIHPTLMPEECIKYADVVCIGEGERAMLEIAGRISKGDGIKDIKNLWIREGNNIIKNEIGDLVTDLDSISLYKGFKNYYYFDNNKLDQKTGKKFIYNNAYRIVTTRGCPFSCSYCCNNALKRIYKGKGNYVRRRTVNNVIEELKWVKKIYKNVRVIEFFDDVFAFDKEWLKEFCRRYKEIGIPFFCYVHPKTTDEEMILIMRNAGFKYTTVGIQSGSDTFRRKYYNRFDSNEDTIKMVRLLRKHKINVHFDVIVDSPFETENDKIETLKLLLEFPRPFGMHHFSMTHFPKTDFTELCLKERKISEDDVEGRKQSCYGRDNLYVIPLDKRRNKIDLFYDCLYYLAKKRYPSKKAILKLSKNKFLRRHPEYLAFLLRMFTYDMFYPKSKFKKMIHTAYRFAYCLSKKDYETIERYIKSKLTA